MIVQSIEALHTSHKKIFSSVHQKERDMEAAGGTGRGKNRTMEKLSLEDYVRFIRSNNHYDLTVDLLKQIIHMHGFNKGRGTKSILAEAVNSIKLMDPMRSTLTDSDVAANAYISLEEAVKDLGELNWTECCVTSTQMVNYSNYSLTPRLLPPNNNLMATTSSSSVLVKRKRKLRKLAAIQDSDAAEGGDGEGVWSTESAFCSGGGSGGSGGGARVVREVRAKTYMGVDPLAELNQ